MLVYHVLDFECFALNLKSLKRCELRDIIAKNFVREMLFFMRSKIIGIFVVFVVFFCAVYSLGCLDFLKMKTVVNKQFGQGDFTYTGSLLEGRLFREGLIKYGGSSYACAFEKGLLSKVKFEYGGSFSSFEFGLRNGVVKEAYVINGSDKRLFFDGNSIILDGIR